MIFTFADMDALPGFPRIAFRLGIWYQSRIKVFTRIDPIRYHFRVSDIHDLGRSLHDIDQCYSAPASQVPIHFAGVYNQ